jgi:hypothetical protein
LLLLSEHAVITNDKKLRFFTLKTAPQLRECERALSTFFFLSLPSWSVSVFMFTRARGLHKQIEPFLEKIFAHFS